MTDTAISLLVAVLLLPGIGSGVAAARARRRGDPRRSLRLRLPALFFASTLLNASYPWQHRAQRLVAVSLGEGPSRNLGPRRVACAASRDGRRGRGTRLTRLHATRMGVSGDRGRPRQGRASEAPHMPCSLPPSRGHTPTTAGCER